jgi:hypothetical protein
MDLGEESIKLRHKAEKVRAKALTLDDPHLRDELLSIAEQYEALASRAEQAHARI